MSKRVMISVGVALTLSLGGLVAVLLTIGSGGVTQADVDAVTFEEANGAPSQEWIDSVDQWLSSEDSSYCGITMAQNLQGGLWGDQLVKRYTDVNNDGGHGFCEGDDPNRGTGRVVLLSVERYESVSDARASEDSSADYLRSEPSPHFGGQAWVGCWDNDICRAMYFADGILLTGTLYYAELDPEPSSPQDVADWFAEVLPKVTAEATPPLDPSGTVVREK